MTTNDLITNLVAVTARLIDLMGREIDLLRAMKPREIDELQDEKSTLARRYADAVQQLSSEPERLASVAPGVRDELKRATERFEVAVAENARALRSASEANARLIKAIVEAAEGQIPRAEGYTPTGGTAARLVGPRGRAVALSINQQF